MRLRLTDRLRRGWHSRPTMRRLAALSLLALSACSLPRHDSAPGQVQDTEIQSDGARERITLPESRASSEIRWVDPNPAALPPLSRSLELRIGSEVRGRCRPVEAGSECSLPSGILELRKDGNGAWTPHRGAALKLTSVPVRAAGGGSRPRWRLADAQGRTVASVDPHDGRPQLWLRSGLTHAEREALNAPLAVLIGHATLVR